MLLPVLAWVAGILCGRYLGLPASYYLWFGISVFVASVIFKRIRVLLILLLFFSFGALRFLENQPKPSPLMLALLERGEVQQQMQFHVENRLAERVFQARLQSIAGIRAHERVLLYSDHALIPGAYYTSLAVLQPVHSDPLLDIYPQRFNAILMPLLPLQEADIQHQASVIHTARAWVQGRLDQALGPYSPPAKALLLSDTEYKRENQVELSRAGITHLVVVSGLHVMMLSLIVLIILRFFVPTRLAELLFMAFLLFFAALNNWAPPILRAMLMIDLLILSRWLSRPLSAAQGLAVALFIITLVNPTELFQLGLQLSFVSVALIVFALPHGKMTQSGSIWIRKLRVIANYMLVSLVVGLGIIPISLYYFGSASLNGIIGNLLGLPLMTILLGLSLLCLFFPLKVFILSFQAVADAWKAWMLFCAGLPFRIAENWISLGQAFALGLLVWLVLLAIKGRFSTLWKATVVALPAVALMLLLPGRRSSEVHFFDAGVADCCLVFADDGTTLMVDTGGLPGQRAETSLQGGAWAESWMSKKLLIWLARNNIRKLDYLLITHLHSDHAGGLQSLLHSTPVRNLIISQNDLQSTVWQELTPSLRLNDTRIIAVADTFSISLGVHRLKILHPVAEFVDPEMNNHSIVCRYDAGKISFLLTGDIEHEAETWLVNRYPEELKADVLKVAHHGSRGSSTPSFIRQVMPQEAVFSASKRNVYGFPHPEVIRRFEEHGAVARFTHAGSISYKTDE